MQQLRVLFFILQITVLAQLAHSAATGRVVLPSRKNGGRGGKRKQSELTFSFLVKSFFTTMVDPTYQGAIILETSSPSSMKAKGGKGKKYKLGGAASPSVNVFGEGGATFGGGSFGPVCGPNGCH